MEKLRKLTMDFNDIFDRLTNRIWTPLSNKDAVNMIIASYAKGNISDDEKNLLLKLV